MKKLFTLLTLTLMSIGSAWADDTYTVSFATKPWTQSTADYFTSAGEKNNLNTKFACKYDGTEFSQGLKMEGSTKVQFTASRTFDITIVRSTASGASNTINFGTAAGDKTALTFGSELSDDNNSKVAVATLTDLEAGTYQIVRGSAEAGIVFISVTEKGASMTQLSAPEISYAAATGTVTIGAVANATKVTYTLDGSAPTASSEEYNAPFVVEDGTVVKAMAIGNGTTYSNSEVATNTVLLTGITIATPVIKQFNGAVAITCASSSATIKYSTDGGSTYNTYVRSFTLTSDATVQAYAERSGCTNSAVTSDDVTVIATNKTKTIYLDWNDFDDNDKNSATGKTGTDAEGYTLTITGNGDKKWSSNGYNITTPAGAKQEWKVSNGAQNTLTIPAGVHVTKLTIYSIINNGKNETANGWKEVGGIDYQTGDGNYKNVPMGAYTDIVDYNTNPDVRVYDIDQTGGSITFTNAGNQLCFVIALDILEDHATIAPTTLYSTYVTTTALDFDGMELKAFVATGTTASSVTLTEVTAVPAGTPLVLKKGSASSYDVPVAASAAAPAKNLLRGSATESYTVTSGVTAYGLSDGKFVKLTEGTIPVGKAYLLASDFTSAPELAIEFNGETTSISEELSVKSEEFTNSVFDLQGRRVAHPTKGLYIVNGRKVVIK